MDKKEISSFNIDEMIEEIKPFSQKPYRAKQIYEWLNKKLVKNFNDMTNLPLELRESLGKYFYIASPLTEDKLVSKEDNTTKYLFRFEKNTIIESVLMAYSYGNTVCVSTQAGCRMGCKFCVSAKNGLDRNLTPGEMLNEVYEIQKDSGERVSNVVLMGSGEPLDNYDNVLKFIDILCSEEGLNLGQRHITLSTCGIVDKIRDLAERKTQITLAVSLHAPNDDIRKKTMPVANKYSMDEILKACKSYSKSTGRRVTYEYALIKGVNSSRENAHELSKKLHKSLSHVNLIPVNDSGDGYKSPGKKDIENFADILREKGIETTIRRKLGSDINAACGQLRGNYISRSR